MKLYWMDLKMGIEKGDIYLANLGDVKCADIGKIRPVLIFQNNMLNRMIDDNLYDDIVIVPLSSKLKENDFTYFINKQDKLTKDSVVLCNAIKMIKSKRLLLDKGVLTKLSDFQMYEIQTKLSLLLDFQ